MPVSLLYRAGLVIPVGLLATAIAYVSSRAPLAALAALGAGLVGLLVVAQPQALLVLLVAALPWEGFLDIPSETLSVVKLLGFLLFLSVALAVARGDRKLYFPATGWAVALFGLLVGLSLVVSPDAGAGVGKMLRYALFVVFFFVVVELIDDRTWLMRILRTVALSVTAAAAAGLVLFVVGSEPRAAGPITDPNDYGYLLAAALPLVLYLLVEDRAQRWLWGVSVPIVLIAMIATLSRSVITVALALVVWAIATRRIRIRGLIASALVAVGLITVVVAAWSPLVEERVEQRGAVATENVASREALWRAAVSMSMDRPLTGVGPDRFAVESVEYVRDNPVVLTQPVTHNTYLEILAENGPIALAAFIAFLAGTWLALRQAERSARTAGDRAMARLAVAMQASLLAAMVGALFLSEQLATPFWLVGALAAASLRLAPERRLGAAP